MKRLISMLLVIGVGLFSFGCQKDYVEPDLSVDDQETAALKAAKVKRTFEGICTIVLPPAVAGDNEWHDETDDWRTTGTTIWVTDPGGFFGTVTLTLDPKNPHELNRGIWEMEWSGDITPTDDGLLITATAAGEGIAGKVKGMKANWTYTMNYVGDDFPNPANPTLFYVVEGSIEKPQGPIKKN
jgi:hypothetical protein